MQRPEPAPTEESRSLGGYAATLLLYGLVVTAAALLAAATGRTLPRGMTTGELVRAALAAHKLSRLVTKSSVATPVRAPFTRPAGDGGPGEVGETPKRETGLWHSLGELLSCPFCLDVWVVTGLTLGHVFAPRLTRVLTDAAAALAGADFLHLAYATAQQIAEGEIPLASPAA